MNNKIKVLAAFFFVILLSYCNTTDKSPDILDIPTQLEKPKLISPLDGSSNQLSSVGLYWKNPGNVHEYKVQIALDKNFSTLVVDTFVSGSSVYPEKLETSSTYYWRVYLTDENREGIWSDIRTFSTGDDSLEGEASELKTPDDGKNLTSEDLTFSWDPVPEAVNYFFQITTDPGFETTIIDTLLSTTTLGIDNLEIDEEYLWRVSPILESKTGIWSDARSFTLLNEEDIPVAVSLNSPADNSGNQPLEIIFEWEDSPDANEYSFQLSENSSFSPLVADTLTSENSLKIGSLDFSQNYYWRVMPVIDSEKTDWSEIWSLETIAEETDTELIRLISPSDGESIKSYSIKFEWEPLPEAVEYRYQISKSDDFRDAIIDSIVAAEELEIDALDNSENYLWRVQPILGNGQRGQWSHPQNFSFTFSVPAVQLVSPKHNTEDLPSELTFEWNKVNGFKNYHFQLSDDKDFESFIENSSVEGTDWSITGLDDESTYYWRVQVEHDRDGDFWSKRWTLYTKSDKSEPENPDEPEEPESPEIPIIKLTTPDNAAKDQPTKIKFQWQSANGYDNYQFQLAKTSNFSSVTEDRKVNGTSFTYSDLEYETTYYWRVQIEHDENENYWSKPFSLTIKKEESDHETPDDPEIPVVELSLPDNKAENLPTGVTFEWQDAENFDEYQFQLSSSSNFSSLVENTTVKNTEYELNDLDYETTYYWRVQVQNDSKDDFWSATRSFSTEPEEVPEMGRVTLKSPTNSAGSQPTDLTFEWNSMPGAENYRIMVDENNSFKSSVVDETVTGLSFDANDLEQGTTYYWGVRAQAGEDIGEWSETWSFTTENTEIGTVSLSSPSDGSTNKSTSLTLNWQDVQNVDEYQVQLATNNSFSSIVDDENVFDTSYNISGLKSDQAYYWRVRGIAGNNSGKWSPAWTFNTEKESTPPPPNNSAFVRTQNSNFVIDGQVFRFAGTNAYYLPNYEKLNSSVVDRAFDIFEETGINVVRMWAFYDGFDCGYSKNDSSENVIQTAPGEYNERALRDLDRVIAKGKEKGIRFILPLVNYWDELGGICQYNTWAGASNPGRNMSFFISNSDTQKWFKDYIEMLLNRVNTVTGVRYKNEPAIFAWQIMNEGRNSGENPEILRDWYREIAQYIKSIDSKHLVSTGEEGFDEGTPSQYSTGQYSNTYVLRANEGTSYIMNTNIPEIDFGSAHWYPADYGFGSQANSDLLSAQRAWLRDHQKIAENAGKPFVLGEYGHAGWGDNTQATIYDEIFNYAESINLDGSLLWQLTADGTKCWEFGGNICYPAGREDTELYNRFRKHVQSVK